MSGPRLPDSRPDAQNGTEKPPEVTEARADPSQRTKKQPELCSQCREQPSKYKCPGCGAQTCGLACVKGHKSKTGCSGKRNRAAFVKLAEFNDNYLMSDYNFLEESLQEYEAARKLRAPLGSSRYQLPPAMAALQNQARNRAVTLLYIAQGMTKRKRNSTFYDKRRRCIYWRVEWHFPSANIILVDGKMDENATLVSGLERHLAVDPSHRALKEPLAPYAEACLDSLHLLIRKEPCPANNVRYIALKASESLASQISKLVIIEFPTIVVALPSELEKFPLAHVDKSREEKAVEMGSVKASDSVESQEIGSQPGRVFREEEIDETRPI